MTSPSHSLLVLAWDDADPGAHPASAPPTLPVLRQLAAHQPLLAVLPELPAEVQTTAYQAEVEAQQAGEATEPAAATAPAEAAADDTHLETSATLGIVLLPLAATEVGVAASHIIGLADLGGAPTGTFIPELSVAEPPVAPVAAASPQPAAPLAEATPIAAASAPLPSPLPALLASFVHHAPRPAAPWLVPATPYLGSSLPPRPAEAVGSAEAADLRAATIPEPLAGTPATPLEDASAVLTDPALAHNVTFAAVPAPAATEEPELPATTPPLPGPPAPEPDAFAQTAAEIGPEEAADLYAAEDNLTLAPEEADSALLAPLLPEAPERATLSQALQALHRIAPEPEPELPPAIDLAAADLIEPEPLPPTVAPPVPLSDNLHYRIIQYARFATHVAAEQSEEFGAIYAPNWPTWLAALEIRYRSRRPLVLHLTELAAATAAPAERGWRLELERYALRRAHTILVATDALRRQLIRHYGHPPGRLRVIAPDDEAGINAILAKVGTVADF